MGRTMFSRGRAVATLVGAVAALSTTVSACGAGTPAAVESTNTANSLIGVHTETLVDPSRSTPANGSVPGHQGRTLVVSVWYPSKSTSQDRRDVAPDRSGAPYPLIVFAHGFPADPSGYAMLLERWAAAGYVVAAPKFPLTNPEAPGGPDLADYVNQPGDMSYVVTQLEAQSKSASGLLHGMVDPNAIGAAGHSLGGVTTLGLVANSCCHDSRIKAAVVMAGDQLTFPGGQSVPPTIPVLFVHGNADETVPYVSSVVAFNAANAPKGLLTIDGGGHEAPVGGAAFNTVVRTTTAFFDLYLKHKGSASKIQADGTTAITKLTLASQPGQTMTLPVPKSTAGKLSAQVVPSTDLADGQQVDVSWQGYTPGITVNVLQCSVPVTGAQDCDLQRSKVGVPDPTGSGSVSFEVHTGPIGTGICDATHPKCVVVVNQGGSSNPADTVLSPVSFG